MYPEEVIRYISGNYSREDEEFVENWLAANPEAREELKRLKRVWKTSGKLKLENNVDEVWEQLSKKVKAESQSEKISRIGRFPTKNPNSKIAGVLVRIAAAILIIAGTYGFYQLTYNEIESDASKKELVYHTLVASSGEQIHFRFNDGSKVVLNGNSEVRYRSDFGSGTRDLYLTGEAYFEVNHDHPVPFVVYAGNMRVKDIGTKFNINAYPADSFYEVAVSEGLIEITTAEEASDDDDTEKTSQPVRISQGQKVEVEHSVGEMVISKADLHASLGWLNKRLIFDEEPLSEIVSRIERYYDIDVKVLDEELLTKKVTASFENEGMENVLKVLSLSLKANYNINGKKVELYKNRRPIKTSQQ